MKRSALGVWRCDGAISPGMMICNPANSESQMNVVPRKVGFSRHSTRRSASFLVMRSQARSSCGRTVE